MGPVFLVCAVVLNENALLTTRKETTVFMQQKAGEKTAGKKKRS